MKVRLESLPQTGGIKTTLPKIDFADTFSTTNHQDSLAEISRLVFAKVPKWIEYLMRLRNSLVKVFPARARLYRVRQTNYKLPKPSALLIFDISAFQQTV